MKGSKVAAPLQHNCLPQFADFRHHLDTGTLTHQGGLHWQRRGSGNGKAMRRMRPVGNCQGAIMHQHLKCEQLQQSKHSLACMQRAAASGVLVLLTLKHSEPCAVSEWSAHEKSCAVYNPRRPARTDARRGGPRSTAAGRWKLCRLPRAPPYGRASLRQPHCTWNKTLGGTTGGQGRAPLVHARKSRVCVQTGITASPALLLASGMHSRPL